MRIFFSLRRAGFPLFFDHVFRDFRADDHEVEVVCQLYHQRNHAALPGDIQIEDRQADLLSAKEIYARKSRTLLALRSRWRRMLFWTLRLYLIYPVYRLTRRLGISLEAWMGFGERDRTDLLRTQYVSLFDVVVNRRNPYYLVQSIPPQRHLYG